MQVVTTIVKGDVRPSYFGLSEMIYCEWQAADGEIGRRLHSAMSQASNRACAGTFSGAARQPTRLRKPQSRQGSRAPHRCALLHPHCAATILTTEDVRLPWNSLSLVGRTASGNATLWKLFSRADMPHAWLELMFERGEGAGVRVAVLGDCGGARPRQEGACKASRQAHRARAAAQHPVVNGGALPRATGSQALRWWRSACGMRRAPIRLLIHLKTLRPSSWLTGELLTFLLFVGGSAGSSWGRAGAHAAGGGGGDQSSEPPS